MACLPAALEVRSLRGVVDGEALPEMGKKIGMSIYMQHEDIFNAMHNI